MLVKAYAYTEQMNEEAYSRKIIHSIDYTLNKALMLKDNPILESVSHSMYAEGIKMSKVTYPDPLNEEEFNLFYPVEEKIIVLQDIFYDLHKDIPFGLYKLDDIIVASINEHSNVYNSYVDIEKVLKAGLIVKGMVLLNQGYSLPSHIEKVIENYSAMKLLEG
jgi:hypothetical protein